jgi:ribosomal protein L11 methyltransferase
MKEYLQVSIPVTDSPQREILIAQLSSLQYEAFEEEPEELKAFIEKDLFNEEWLKEALQEHALDFSIKLLPATNWNEEWEKNFQPVVVDDFCGIRANFHKPIADVQYEIVITPKMSFGTGHHATTFMMVKMMREVNFREKYVFDFGTGTGILAILADKLGAAEVFAIDNDEWSMLNAAENVAANECNHVVLQNEGNIPANRSFDIVLANINKVVIEQTLPRMKAQLNKKGKILLSGLLEKDFADVNGIATQQGLTLNKQLASSGWIALLYDSD